jgi:DNA-binding CsgD family transcriptional regulator/tetratricopeptide (TPR) repeat protein
VISEPVLCRKFVGRVAELDHVLARRRAAATGHGGTVLVAGAAGIGKSRFLSEFRRVVPRRATRIASGACRPFAQRPLGPWLDVLGRLDPAAATNMLAHPSNSKDEQMATLVDTFARLSARAATVVLIEDLHWADPDIWQLLLVLTERAVSQRMLFIATYRDDELTPSHPCFLLLGHLLRDRATSLCTLGPFDDREVSELLRDALPPDVAVPPDLLRDVQRRCEGNALFAEELLRHTVDNFRCGDIGSDVRLPISLQAVVAERLTRCSEDDRGLLSRASLFGRSFEIDLLASIFDARVDWCREALDRLRTLQLIDSFGTSGEYRFRHALTRDVVYAAIPEADLGALHGRIADAIALRPDADADIERLAHHYWFADAREKAAPFCDAAGDAARVVHAYEDAAGWYERAAQGYAGDAEVAGALVKGGLMLVLVDRIDRALTFYERASTVYENAGDIDEAIATRAMAAGPLSNAGRVDEATAFMEETWRRFGPRASPFVRDRLRVRLGFFYAFARRTDDAWKLVQAIDFDALDSNSALAAEARFLRSALHAQRAEPGPWRRDFEIGLATFERLDVLPDNIRTALGNAGFQALCLGETALARAYQERAVELAGRLQSGLEYEKCFLAQIELRAGGLSAARSIIDAFPSPRVFNARVERTVVALELGHACGDDDLERLLDAGLLAEARERGVTSATVKLSCASALALESLGRHFEVERLLVDAAATMTTTYDMTVPIATIAWLRPNLAQRLRPLVEPAAGRDGDLVDRALLEFLDAAAARECGDRAQRAARGRSAARQFAAIGWHLLEARALDLAGDVAPAGERYASMGAYAELRRLERTALELRATSDGTGLLTNRERELAHLVAAGKSNRAAAEALSISEKAVEKYLTSVYAKLGMTSRAQLAAYVAGSRFERT